MLNLETGKLKLSNHDPKADRVSFAIGGDFLAADESADLIRSGKSGDIIRDIKPFLDACDLRIINFEAPMTTRLEPIPKAGPCLKMAPFCVDFLKTAGIDVVTLANNHIGDYGPAAVEETLAILDNHGIKYTGAGSNLSAALSPLMIEHNSLKIGIISVCENEFGIAGAEKAGSAPLDPVVNISAIRHCAAKADITLVFVHGGNEYNPIPSPRMVKTYRAFIEAGADAVIGNHTHCPQGLEIWQNKPIIYSTGNWLFKSLWHPYNPNSFWWTGYMVNLSFSRNTALDLEILPYHFGPNGERISPLSGSAKQRFNNYLTEISAPISDSDSVNRFFEGWSTMMGPVFADWLQHPIAKSEVDLNKALSIKNVFHCEAHHEIMKTYLKLIEENRLTEAALIQPDIERLQQAAFLWE